MTRLTLFASATILTIGVTACGSHGPTAPTASPTPTAASASTGITGQISGLAGTRSAFQFNVAGTPVQGDTSTAFQAGSEFNELHDGLTVQINGAQQPGRVYATVLAIVSPTVNVTGTITNKSGIPPEFNLTIGGGTVNVTALTKISRKGDPQTSFALSTGQNVDVVGRVIGDNTVVATSINILSDAPGGGFWIEGAIGALSGTCPHLRLTVNGYTGSTDFSTIFDGACDALAVGNKVQINGVVKSDLSIMIGAIKRF